MKIGLRLMTEASSPSLPQSSRITYNHGQLTAFPVEAGVAHIEHQGSHAVEEHEDCKSDVELRRGGVVAYEDVVFPRHITHVAPGLRVEGRPVQPMKKIHKPLDSSRETLTFQNKFPNTLKTFSF